MGYVIGFLATLAIVCLIIQWYAGRPNESNELPPLVIPLAIDPALTVPGWSLRSTMSNAPAAQPAHDAQAMAPSPFAPPATPSSSFAPPTPPPPMLGGGTLALPSASSRRDTPSPLKVVRDLPGNYDDADFDDPAPAETVRFRRPGDEPVQLLPGRLEVVSGDPRHDEIRFVRLPGRPAELILGRDPGDSMHHVTLRSATVSRRHARFGFANGHWMVSNLSHTNPVVLNDHELSPSDGERDLSDGDRLELGEVVLRFHAR